MSVPPRAAISDHRLVTLDARDVTFRTRGDAKVTLQAEESLQRFVLHVLPRGFVKVRHHGLFAAGNVHSRLQLARTLRARDPPRNGAPSTPPAETPLQPRDFRDILCSLTGLDLRACARCGAFDLVRCPLGHHAALDDGSPHTFDHPPRDTS